MSNPIQAIIQKYGGDETRLMDILIDIQDELGFLSPETVAAIARALGVP